MGKEGRHLRTRHHRWPLGHKHLRSAVTWTMKLTRSHEWWVLGGGWQGALSESPELMK